MSDDAAQKVARLAREARGYVDRVLGETDADERRLYLHAGIVKLVGALDVVLEIEDPNAIRWNGDLWRRQQEELRAHIEGKRG